MRGDVLTLAPTGLVLRGTLEKFTVATPAVATGFTRTTAQGTLERIRTVTFTYVADANVANRSLEFDYQDGDGNTWGMAHVGAVLTAGQSARIGAGIGQTTVTAAAGIRLSVALPDVYLSPGDRFTLSIQLAQAGDQVAAIRGLVERYSIGPDGYPLGEVYSPDTTRGRGYGAALESE